MDIEDISSRLPLARSPWVIKFARVGLTAKGIVYCIVGALAFMAAFEIDGASEQDAGKQGVFRFILGQPYGKVLLAIVVAGMACYTLWRFIQALKDTENKGNDAKGLGRRAGYAFSGAIYGALAYYAAKLVTGLPGSNSNSGGDDSRQVLARELLLQPFGDWLLGAVGLGTIGMGFYQFYRAYSGSYMKRINSGQIKTEIKKTLIRAGRMGYLARGVVWMVIGILFIKAAMAADSREAGGSTSAFRFIEESTYGSYALGTVAIGLICYGVFMFVRAKYEVINNV